ncbi:MAG: ABC transporter substrate-binding protein [Crenarchaeota archaeon]|nr:ABC transporter substrate-binding protein [Thermoproteota archaeon]
MELRKGISRGVAIAIGIIIAAIVIGLGAWMAHHATTSYSPTSTSSPSATFSPTTSSSTSTTFSLSGTLVFYTSIPKDIAVQLVKMFEQKYPNVHVILVRSGTGKLIAKLLAEIKAGKIEADVVWVADPASMDVLKDKGVLLKWMPPEAKYIPKELRDPDGYWVAGRVIMQVIAYNTKLIKNPPQRWVDLINKSFVESLPDGWKNGRWLGMPSPLYSGAVAVTVYALTHKYGWSYFETLAKNNWVVFEKSNGVVLKGVLTGEYPIGITLDYMVRMYKKQGAPVAMVLPKDGLILIPSPIAIIKTTKNLAAAKAFVEFMLSREVQEYLSKCGIMPARTDVSPPPGTPSLSELEKYMIKINWDEMAKQLQQIKEQFEKLIIG